MTNNDCKSCHFWDRNKHVAYTKHGTEILAACLNPECPWVGMDCNGGCKFWTRRELQKMDAKPSLLHVGLCEDCCERIAKAWNQRVVVKFSEPRTID